MNERNPIVIVLGTVASLGGAAGSWFASHFSLLLSGGASIMAMIAAWFACRAAAATIAAKRAERARENYQLRRSQFELCRECRSGRIPENCPLPPELRPSTCPLTQKPPLGGAK